MTRAKDISRLITDANFAGTLTVGDLTASSLNGGQFGGRRNIVINGAMQVAQRATSASSVTSSGYHTVDRMALGMENLGAYTVAQETLTSGNAYNAGFKKAFRVDCTTADASPASDDSLFFQYKLEGQDMNGFKKGTSEAEKFTLQFWVKSNKTGTGQVVLFDDNSRAVGKTYTISSANTWEHKVLTFPADTSGAIDNDNTKGFEIEWALDAGSTFQGGTLPATWGSSNNNFRSINDFAIGDNTNNDWAITGIQLEVGSVATPFEHRSYGEELQLCQRYLFKDQDGSGAAYKRYAHGGASATTVASCSFTIPTPLRAVPTLVLSGDVNTFLAFSAGATDALTGLIIATDDDAGTFNRAVELTATVGSGLVAGEQVSIISNNSTSTFISLDAEL
jgi:hypothetical protein